MQRMLVVLQQQRANIFARREGDHKTKSHTRQRCMYARLQNRSPKDQAKGDVQCAFGETGMLEDHKTSQGHAHNEQCVERQG